MSAPFEDAGLSRLLRALVLADIVLAVMLAGLTIQYDSQLQAAVAADPAATSPSTAGSQGSLIQRLSEVAVAALVLTAGVAQIASWMGLLFHRNWARWLYLILLISERGLQLPYGAFSYGLSWHFLDGLNLLRYQCTGALLVTVFCTSLAGRFQPGSGSK